MSLVNDINSVKKAVSENWDDILTTADQLEKLISDGLLWLEDENNIANVKSAISGIQLPDLDLKKLATMLQTNEAVIAAELDPVLSKLQTLMEADETDIEEIISFIETSIKGLNLVSLPEWKGVDLDALKNMLSAIVNEGFSVSTVDLPLTKNTTYSTQNSVANTATTTPANTETQPSSTANTSSQTSSTNPTLQPSFTDAQDGLFAGLEQHFMDTIAKYETDIETLLGNFQQLLPDNIVADLETKMQQIATNISSQPLTTATLIQQLSILSSDTSLSLGTILPSVFNTLVNTLVKLTQIFSDLLSAQTLDADTEISNLYLEITKETTPPTPLKVVCLLAAIPMSTISNGILGKGIDLSTDIFQGNTDSKNNEKYAVSDFVELVPESLKLGYSLFRIYTPAVTTGKRFKEKVVLFADLFSIICEIVATVASEPDESSDFTALPINRGVWLAKIFIRPCLMASKLFTDLLAIFYNDKKLSEINDILKRASKCTAPIQQINTAFRNDNFKGRAKNISLYLPDSKGISELINENRTSNLEWLEKYRDNYVNNAILLTQMNGFADNHKNYTNYKQMIERLNALLIPVNIIVPKTYSNANNLIEGLRSSPNYQLILKAVENLNKELRRVEGLVAIESKQKEDSLANIDTAQTMIAASGLLGEMGIGLWYTINYNLKGYTKNYDLIAVCASDTSPAILSNLNDLLDVQKVFNSSTKYKRGLGLAIITAIGKLIGGIISIKRKKVIIQNLVCSDSTLVITFSDKVKNDSNKEITGNECFTTDASLTITKTVSSSDDRTITLTFSGGGAGKSYTFKPTYNKVFDQYGFPLSSVQDINSFSYTFIENTDISGVILTLTFNTIIQANQGTIGTTSFSIQSNITPAATNLPSISSVTEDDSTGKSVFTITLNAKPPAGNYKIVPVENALKDSNNNIVSTEQANNTFTIQ